MSNGKRFEACTNNGKWYITYSTLELEMANILQQVADKESYNYTSFVVKVRCNIYIRLQGNYGIY